MAENLSAASWTAFAKKQKLEKLGDEAFIKALAKYEKSDKLEPEARVEILGEVVEQANKLVLALAKRKKDLGDKPFAEAKDKVHALLDEAERQQKAARAEASKKGSEEDEPDTPALLSSKMTPLLTVLKTGKGEVRMHALVCTAGKNTSVLIMKTEIAASRRKLLMEAVDAKGGAKFIEGECLYENGVLTFVVKSPAGGLAARIHNALLAQTAKKLKVKVRGEDGVTDEGGEEDPDGSQDQDGGAQASPEEMLYRQRLPAVQARLDEALAAQHPESTKLRALIGFASEKADGQKDFAAGNKALDMLEKLLGSGTTRGTGTGSTGKTPDYERCREAWVRTKAAVSADIQKLEQAILAAYRDTPYYGEIEQKVRKLDTVMQSFGEDLETALASALAAVAADTRQQHHKDAVDRIEAFKALAANDPLIAEIEGNPFVEVNTRKALVATLDLLARQLA